MKTFLLAFSYDKKKVKKTTRPPVAIDWKEVGSVVLLILIALALTALCESMGVNLFRE